MRSGNRRALADATPQLRRRETSLGLAVQSFRLDAALGHIGVDLGTIPEDEGDGRVDVSELQRGVALYDLLRGYV